jgi:hypothetical protein
MTPTDLLRTLESRGARFWSEGGRISWEAPRGVLEPADLEALRRSKPSLLSLLRKRQAAQGEAYKASVDLDIERVTLGALDRILEIAVPWSDFRLLLVPGCRLARELRKRDAKPGRVWCTCEVLDLLLSGVSPEDARKVGLTKLDFGGQVTRISGPHAQAV